MRSRESIKQEAWQDDVTRVRYPSKHDTLKQCCFNVGPESKRHLIGGDINLDQSDGEDVGHFVQEYLFRFGNVSCLPGKHTEIYHLLFDNSNQTRYAALIGQRRG